MLKILMPSRRKSFKLSNVEKKQLYARLLK
jgi:hypothetical protein